MQCSIADYVCLFMSLLNKNEWCSYRAFTCCFSYQNQTQDMSPPMSPHTGGSTHKNNLKVTPHIEQTQKETHFLSPWSHHVWHLQVATMFTALPGQTGHKHSCPTRDVYTVKYLRNLIKLLYKCSNLTFYCVYIICPFCTFNLFFKSLVYLDFFS